MTATAVHVRELAAEYDRHIAARDDSAAAAETARRALLDLGVDIAARRGNLSPDWQTWQTAAGATAVGKLDYDPEDRDLTVAIAVVDDPRAGRAIAGLLTAFNAVPGTPEDR